MSTTLIKLKKSSVTGKKPVDSDLAYGELALNYADGKLYFKNSSNVVKAFGDSAQTETLFDAKFSGKSTTDLTEGTNLYYTTARFDTAFSGKSTTNLTEGTNLYYTTARFDSDFGDNTTTDLTEGTNLYYTTARADSDFDVRLATKTTTNLTEGTNLYYTTARADSDAKNAISVTDNGGDGSLTYSAATGVITYTGPSATDVRAHFTGGSNININSGVIALDSAIDVGLISAQLTPKTSADVSYVEGKLWYSSESKTLQVYSDDSAYPISVGEREFVRCRNSSGATITKGTPVYVTGVHIAGHPVHGHHPTIAPADASHVDKYNVIGIAGEDIADGAHGYVTVRGWIQDIDTSNLTPGSRVHLGFASPGTIIDTAPSYPNYPSDLGICLTADSAGGGGSIYVDIAQHSFESIRVEDNVRVGGNLTVTGDLTVNGTQSIVSSANLAVDTAFIYSNSGDTIGLANTNFSGSGLNDGAFRGYYHGTTTKTFYVRIDGVGTGTGGVDTFEWSLDNFSTTEATGVDITGERQALSDNIDIRLVATTGHTSGDVWYGTAAPVNVDAGFASNRNTGTSGVGYTHMGVFFDVTDEKWKFFKSYYPEPEGTIDVSDSSYEKATVDANLTGNVTGDLTGTASIASTLGGLSSSQFLRSDAADTKTSGDLSFSDNVKATFGDSADLQIYHDGTHSYIEETGTGNLALRASAGVYIQKYDGTENLATFLHDDAVTLYYDNAAKVATTSTGIDVTGTVLADGLTVADGTSGQINVHSTSYNIQGGSNYGDMRFNAPRLRFYEDGTTIRLNIDDGDVSFYNSTGTAAKFFWDASAESLGVGTTSPGTTLDVNGTIRSIGNNDANYSTSLAGRYDSTHPMALYVRANSATNSEILGVYAEGGGASPRTVINPSNGWNVGIGTTSPSAKLEINVSGATNQLLLTQSTTDHMGLLAGTNGVGIISEDSNYFAIWHQDYANRGTETGLTERFRIDASGNVGIGTNSPGVPLDVNGTARATQFRLANTGVFDDGTATTTSTSQVAIDQWSATTYGGAKVIIEAKDGSDRHIVELLVTHNGTNAFATEYGVIKTGLSLVTYDVDISGGNVRILATPASTNSTSFKVMRQTMFS